MPQTQGSPSQLWLAGEPAADQLLSSNPLALLLGMLLDQQIPMERAFRAPLELKRRLGSLDAAEIAAMGPEAIEAAFVSPPALHRFPRAMADRFWQLCQIVVDCYGSRPEAIWEDAPSGDVLLARLAELPGFGIQKAQIFLALLGKQLGIRPPGWREAAFPYGEPNSTLSVADIRDPETLAAVRAHKAEAKRAAKGHGS
jgi:uncharacterized HhH-GPD family protein